MNSTEDRLFSYAAQTQSLPRARELVAEDPDLSTILDVDSAFFKAEDLIGRSCEEFVAFIDSFDPEATVLRSFLSYWYLLLNANRLTSEMLKVIHTMLLRTAPTGNFDAELAEILLLGRAAREETLSPVRDALREFRTRFLGADSIKGKFVLATANLRLGNVEERLGNFRAAKQAFEAARSVGRKNSFLLILTAMQRLGSLYWSSGLPERALEFHQLEEYRSLALNHKRWNWLVQSYLSASKCARECGDLVTADRELAAAEELQGQPELQPQNRALFWLFSAELEAHRGHLPECSALLVKCRALYTELHFNHMLLEVAAQEVQLLLRRDQQAEFLERSEAILLDARKLESQGTIDKLLYLQSFLKRDLECYEIRNPALRIRAFANQMWMARKRGRINRVQMLLDRIEGMQSFMIESAYDRAIRVAVNRPLKLAV